MEKSQINMVSWYKNDILIEETSLKNIKIDAENMRLVINSLSHKNDNGLYHCTIELKNTQNVSSDKIKIETICKQKNWKLLVNVKKSRL